MKFLVFLFLIFQWSVNITSAQEAWASFPDMWLRAKEYTIEVAEAMPSEKYNYIPAEGMMSFQKELAHIAANMGGLQRYITGDRDCVINDYSESIKTSDKAKVIELLSSSFDYIHELALAMEEDALLEEVDFFAEEASPSTREKIFWLMRNHVTHHRGQLIVYLRLNGVDAPKYRGW